MAHKCAVSFRTCSGYTVRSDGREVQLNDAQKIQIEFVIFENLNLDKALDLLWTKEQIDRMSSKGLFVECVEPEELYVNGQQLQRYCVIANAQNRYLIIMTHHGVETFDFPEAAERKLYHILQKQ